MKKIKIFQIIAISLLIIFVGCSKENINPDFEDLPVVEGYLYAGQPLEIKVSRQVPYSNNAVYSSDNLDSLTVSVFDGNLYYKLFPIGNGKYTNSNIKVNQLHTLEVEFDYNNLPVSAQTTIPEKPGNFLSSTSNVYVSDDIFTLNNPDELEFSWDNPDGSYHFLLIENMESNPTPIFDNNNISNINQLFKLTPTQSNNYSMKTRRFSYYGNHRIILFHINPDLAALYEESDNTSQNITNPPTALENALGIFTGINADTLYVNVKPH